MFLNKKYLDFLRGGGYNYDEKEREELPERN